jgi:hypothetical protein
MMSRFDPAIEATHLHFAAAPADARAGRFVVRLARAAKARALNQ